MAKGYDKVDWGFIEEIMDHMGFPSQWFYCPSIFAWKGLRRL